mgnify:CR=1 FL=1
MLKRFAAQNEIIAMAYGPSAQFHVLDLGTEDGHTGRTIKAAFPHAKVTGIELHAPMLKTCEDLNGSHYESLILGDAVKYLEEVTPFNGLVDVAVAAEIIEHLPRDRGLFLLDLLEKKARLAIVTSPLGFKTQGPIHDNPHEVHVSGWVPEDFTSRGWTAHLLDRGGFTLGVYYRRAKW